MKPVPRAFNSTHKSEDGTAVLVLLIFLAILLLYTAFNLRTLHLLGRDVKLVDQQQIRRLQRISQTNSLAVATNSSPASTVQSPSPK